MFKRACLSVCKAPRSKTSSETLPIGADSRLHAGFRAHRRVANPAELPADDFATCIAEAQRRSDRANQAGPDSAASCESALTPEERRLVRRQRMMWWGIIITTQLLYVSTIISLVLFIVKFQTVGHPWYLIWFLLSFGFMFAATIALWVLWDRRRTRRQVEREWIKLETGRWMHTVREREMQAERVGMATERVRSDPNAGPSVPPKDTDTERRSLQERSTAQHDVDRPIVHPKLPELPQQSIQTPTKRPPIVPGTGSRGLSSNDSPRGRLGRLILVDNVRSSAQESPNSPTSPSVYTDRFSARLQHAKSPVSRVGSPSDNIVSPLGNRSSQLSQGDEYGSSQTVLSPVAYMQSHESKEAKQPGVTSSNNNPSAVRPTGTVTHPPTGGYAFTPRASVVAQDIVRALDGTPSNGDPVSATRKGHTRSATELTSQSLPGIPAPLVELPAEYQQHRASVTAVVDRSLTSTGRDSVSETHPKSLSSLRKFGKSVLVLEPERHDARLSPGGEAFLSASPPISSESIPRPTTAYAEDGWGAFARFNLPPYPDAKPQTPHQAPTHSTNTDEAERSLGIEDDLGGLEPPKQPSSGKSATPSSLLLPIDHPYSMPKKLITAAKNEREPIERHDDGPGQAVAREYGKKAPVGSVQGLGQTQAGISSWLSTVGAGPAGVTPATRVNGEVDRGRQLRRGGSAQRAAGSKSMKRNEEGSAGSKEPNWLDR